jgi:hypothetical protein
MQMHMQAIICIKSIQPANQPTRGSFVCLHKRVWSRARKADSTTTLTQSLLANYQNRTPANPNHSLYVAGLSSILEVIREVTGKYIVCTDAAPSRYVRDGKDWPLARK